MANRRRRLSPAIKAGIDRQARRLAATYKRGIEDALIAQAERLYAMEYPDILVARTIGVNLVETEVDE